VTPSQQIELPLDRLASRGDTATPVTGLRVFYAFRDSPERRVALHASAGSAERYCLFGLDQHASLGVRPRHNLERAAPPVWARALARLGNDTIARLGGYGGDFASVLSSLPVANRADVIVSTVDTVGIPLMLLRRLGLVRPPVVYVAIGLPERLAGLRNGAARRVFARALTSAAAIVAYSQYEVRQLERWLAEAGCGARLVFVPFGVDTDYFRPRPDVVPDVDVVSIGRDVSRDFPLLVDVASRLPERRFRIVAGADWRPPSPLPSNVDVETDVPFDVVRQRLAAARVVTLPVRPNSYSGATTVLLQAMAMAKPVVVSRTEAIASGYELADGSNCVLVEPGNRTGFARSLEELLVDPRRAASLGARARETAVRSLSWQRYAETMLMLIQEAAGRRA
jgi:glycosyltransferase involved in cell wall biosynthesis